MTVKSSLFKKIQNAFTFLLLSVFASQCFSQSAAFSAGEDAARERQYADIMVQLFYYIQQNYVEEIDPEVLYEGALRGMLGALDDPYSVYMAESEWRSLTDTTVGNFGGVGLTITKPIEGTEEDPAYVEVAEPLADSPGSRAGILPGDLIIAIDGVDTSTITMDEVLGMLRGTVGESVTVRIRRRRTIEFDRTLVRAVIENPSVKYGMIEGSGIGYVRISDFSPNTADKLKEAIDTFEDASYKGLIIDLRNNGGGLLSAAVDVADMFIDDGVIVSTKSRISYENSVYHASRGATLVRGLPVVVLVNGATASASEIVSGALKDTKTGYLVGERTYGKGSVQIPRALVDDDGFKITVARYYSPSDVNIDNVGIAPDLEVLYPEFTEEEQQYWHDLEESGAIADYVGSHPDMNEADIRDYAEELSETYKLEGSILRKMVRNEVDRTRPSRLYDLDYDIQLDAAIDIINGGDFERLMSGTKTLAEQSAEQLAASESADGE